MEVSVVLVLQARGLGDLLAAVPALRALRRAEPRSRIVLAAPHRLEQIVDLISSVDELVPTADPAALIWDGPAPELAVNLHGADGASARALADTGAARIIGHRSPALPKLAGPRWDPEAHVVDRWCRLLETEGIAADRRNLGLMPPVTSISRRDCVVVHVGAGAQARRWPPERFAAVVRHLLVLGRDVVLTGDPFEREIAVQVAAQAGLPDDRVLAGRQNLTDLAATVAEAALVISGDTGVAHLATAFGTRTVLLFGPTPPRRGGPPAHLLGRHAVLWAGQVGDPEARVPDPGLLRIGVPEVVSAVDAQLDKQDWTESTRSRYRRVG
ncbi:glycosyltransferase family 9 protein [Nocardia asteroides]|uniref:Glycosyltransferase n=1 Tax=Nocardia asteroides NBRC 15531 TaxID=1110697 RepID=U5EL45_NOCAS|nr:putative glycosyltransferase [Nocardia asteroides NBRC 15531]SFM34934.1 ADP-heptose:LPS heptosyltransferase [Nocardia asteroides]VEG36013.1 ADP-heptose--LPS heptosyltransferase 2 [Nocardia asteroides]